MKWTKLWAVTLETKTFWTLSFIPCWRFIRWHHRFLQISWSPVGSLLAIITTKSGPMFSFRLKRRRRSVNSIETFAHFLKNARKRTNLAKSQFAQTNVAILKALNSKMKQAMWLVRLLWRGRFPKYVTWMVIGYSGGKECCSNVSSRLWGGALRDDTKNGCEGDYSHAWWGQNYWLALWFWILEFYDVTWKRLISRPDAVVWWFASFLVVLAFSAKKKNKNKNTVVVPRDT